MILSISERVGIVVWYVRLMFWTPSPTLETSSEPSLRRPLAASGVGGLLRAVGCAADARAAPPRSGAAARAPADARKRRRPIPFLRSGALITAPAVCSFISTLVRRDSALRLGNRPAVVLEGDAVGRRSAADSGLERVDRGHLLLRELEVEELEVLRDAGALDRLRDRRTAFLKMPPQHHLRGRLAMLARDLEQRRVRERLLREASVGGDAADRRPGLGRDAVLRVHALQRGLLEVRMHLDLVHGGNHRRGAEEVLEMLRHEVAHADRAHAAVRQELLERPVRFEGAVERRRQRLMEEQQVDLLDAELARALRERVQGRVVPVVADPHLRFEEDLVAGKAGATEAFTDLALVGVRGGRVDQPVPRREGGLDGTHGLRRRALEHAESNRRQLHAVVEGDRGA